MFRRFLVWISNLGVLLCELIIPSTPISHTPSTCTTDSQTQSSSVSYSTTISQTDESTFVSGSNPTPQYDVFLSFRGEDTRNNFTSHLYDKLLCNGLRTFMDDPELPRGEVISDALLQAIHQSRTYVVVLSKNYATSHWCLDELVQIFNCHKTLRRLVIHVFYHVQPSAVRCQTESFEKHHTRFAHKLEKVNKWRLTLTQVAHLSGLHISENRSEADMINKIVDEILQRTPTTLHVTKYPVGLNSRVQVILTSLFSSDTEEGFTKIGLYGMGGVGKTTLAKALYNQLLLEGNFKGSSFLADVREISGTPRGLVSLQQQLIDDVLKSKEKVEVHNVEEGIMLIRKRICSAKILLLFDDIDNKKQFESLVGTFVPGSVVIITTRDEEMLEKIKVEPKYRYRVNELDNRESLKLFTKHAFGNSEQNNNLMALSKDILRLAGGLPMALEVFGAYLSTQHSEVGWRSYIEKLQRNPDSTIQQKLVISLNAIEYDDPMLKKIFLDIACCFIRWDKERVVKILETYYSYADHKIDILRKRCLVKIIYNDSLGRHQLGMHDLLKDMGREIVRNNSPNDPGKHSRLWVLKDIYDVLKKSEGTEAVEVIMPHNLYEWDALGMFSLDWFNHFNNYPHNVLLGESFTTERFRRMSKLRFLYLKKVNLTGSFEMTFEDLRWFCWDFCPLKCLPYEFYPQKLVTLELPHSNMRTMWELNMVSHVFKNLKTINMSFSKNLTTTPDFTKFPYLETISLPGCESLEEVHLSIGSLVRLQSLDLQGCLKLRSLPDTICNLRSLEILNIAMCSSLEALPTAIGNIESLKKINAGELSVTKLPDSIGRLSKLVELDLSSNKKLETLLDAICNLSSLEILGISKCERLEILPDQLWKITRLRELNARYATLLRKIPDIGSSQVAISLQKLDLSYSVLTALPSGFSQLSNLECLELSYCRHLLSIPKLPPNLKCIRTKYCDSLERLPNLSNLKQLEKLILSYCISLTEILGLEELTALRELHLTECRGLTYIQDLEELISIRRLRLGGLLAYNLTKGLFQIYAQAGHCISVYAPEFLNHNCYPQWPEWITESPYWTSQSSNSESKVYADLLPNESHNFIGMILCFKSYQQDFSPTTFSYSVKNTTSGFIWIDGLNVPLSELLMVIVPKSIFWVTDDDHRIELTADNVKILGIHLLYKMETGMIEDVVINHGFDNDVLKLVDHVLLDIFLDISCLFIGWKKEVVVSILETYYPNVDGAIGILKNRCLLTISDGDELEMTDLLQHTGRQIACNNSSYEPGKHSRLWVSSDIYEILKQHTGTEMIKSIIPCNAYSWKDALQGESFTSEAFKNMSKLRFLYLKNVDFSGSFRRAFKDLRWLRWDSCPLKCLPSAFYPKKLVTLELPNSNMRTMWEPNMVSHVFEKLKTLNMSFSQELTTTPDFNRAPCLETLNFQGCASLEEVHMSIGSLVRLVSLNLNGCVKLSSLPHTICNLRALKVLDIHDCCSLESLPTALGSTKSPRELASENLTVSKLPSKLRLSSDKNLESLTDAICNLRSLEILDISRCEKLEIYLNQLFTLTRLRGLSAGGATLLKIHPDIGLSQMALSLQKLDFSDSVLTALPAAISQLLHVEYLDLKDCHRLLSVTELPPNLKWIRAHGCKSMQRFPNLSDLKQLEILELTDCCGLSNIQGLKGLTSIRRLHLEGCNPTLLAYIFTKCFFQRYSEFGHPIQISAPLAEFPYWIRQSSEYGSTMCIELLPNVSHYFLGMILCFKSLGSSINYTIKNTTSDFKWSGSFYLCSRDSLMVIVPRSIFSVSDGDDRVELTTEDAEIYGIHLLYKIKGYDSTTVNED